MPLQAYLSYLKQEPGWEMKADASPAVWQMSHLILPLETLNPLLIAGAHLIPDKLEINLAFTWGARLEYYELTPFISVQVSAVSICKYIFERTYCISNTFDAVTPDYTFRILRILSAIYRIHPKVSVCFQRLLRNSVRQCVKHGNDWEGTKLIAQPQSSYTMHL